MLKVRLFTREELRRYDGQNGVAYIAYEGKVYDVSGSYHWRQGVHHYRHHAGLDLTDELKNAPHSIDLLEKCPVVGELIDAPRE